VTVSSAQVEAGWGKVSVAVTPRDACRVLLGKGHTILVSASEGELSDVTDVGDGTYKADFHTAAAQCPAEPLLVSATADGVAIGGVPVKSVCSDIDPASTVRADVTEVAACATKETWAVLRVTPKGKTGLDPAPGLSVVVDADGLLLVAGPVTSETDATGATTYTLKVGSNRCSETPRAVPVHVNGVTLASAPMVTFTCPPVDATLTTFTAASPTALADGKAAVSVVARVVDTCGNPAFGRDATFAATNAALAATVTAAAPKLADAAGTPEDGTATVQLTSTQVGATGLQVTVGEVVAKSADGLVTFTAVPVVAAGGCGCGSGGAGAVPGFLAAAVLLLARRRRRVV
jgi:adhesin/invasin